MAAVTAAVGVAAVGYGLQANAASRARKDARNAAGAAGAAAQEQQAAAQRQFDTISQEGNELEARVVNAANRYSVQELNSLSSAVESQQKFIGEQERLLASVNPTLMEASQQALKLLRGEKASSLGPLEQQRQQQRQALQNSLRAQGLGDGSSAALNALSRFDSETANILNSAQQGQTNTLLQATLASNPNINASTSNLGALSSGYGNIANRETQARLSAGSARLGALSQAGQSVIQNAGAQYTGQVLQGQANAAYNNQMANMYGQIGGQALGMGLGGLMGGAKAPATPQSNGVTPGTFTGQSYTNYGNMA